MNELTPVNWHLCLIHLMLLKFVAEPTTLGDVSGRIDTVSINNQTLSNFIVFALRRNKIPASIVYGENINSSYSNLPDALIMAMLQTVVQKLYLILLRYILGYCPYQRRILPL